MSDIQSLRDKRAPDATSEEQALESTPGGRQWNAWEGDPTYLAAQKAAQELAKDPGAMKAAGGPTGAPPEGELSSPLAADVRPSLPYVDKQNRLVSHGRSASAPGHSPDKEGARIERKDEHAAAAAEREAKHTDRKAAPTTTTTPFPTR